MAVTKRLAKKEEKHRLILETAERLIKEKGLNSINMDELAISTNLAKGTLYLYFKSREEIIAALALKARILLLKAFEKAVAKSDDAVEQLKLVILANYHFLKKNALYYELVSFYEINERDTETEEMRMVSGKIIVLIISIIERGQREGRIDEKINPSVLSFSMWGMTVGVMQLLEVKAAAIKSQKHLTEKDILTNFIHIFEKGIKK